MPVAEKAAVHKQAVDAGVKFASTFPEHPDSAGVLTRAAEDIFAARDLPRAITVSEALLARQPQVDVARQRIGWTIIGQANYDLLFFDKAEAAFVNARTLTPVGDPQRADLTERLAASVYKQAEAKRAAGDALGAVDAFLRVATVAPDSKIRSTATYDAAATLVTLQEWDRAIPVLESFRRDFPQDKLQPEVTRSLAVAYSATGRAGLAATEFERIAASPTEDPAVRREATMQAADLYEKAGNAEQAVAMLEKFVIGYPTPVPEAVEVRQRPVERLEQLLQERLELRAGGEGLDARAGGRLDHLGDPRIRRGDRPRVAWTDGGGLLAAARGCQGQRKGGEQQETLQVHRCLARVVRAEGVLGLPPCELDVSWAHEALRLADLALCSQDPHLGR